MAGWVPTAHLVLLTQEMKVHDDIRLATINFGQRIAVNLGKIGARAIVMKIWPGDIVV